jgi:molybdopterin synthase sulfur carrier subunit
MPTIRIELPAHLRTLAQVPGEVTLEIAPPATITQLLDALELQYPALRGTIRDQTTKQRRPFLRFFACEQDISHNDPNAPLPTPILTAQEPLLILGAIAGG